MSNTLPGQNNMHLSSVGMGASPIPTEELPSLIDKNECSGKMIAHIRNSPQGQAYKATLNDIGNSLAAA